MSRYFLFGQAFVNYVFIYLFIVLHSNFSVGQKKKKKNKIMALLTNLTTSLFAQCLLKDKFLGNFHIKSDKKTKN